MPSPRLAFVFPGQGSQKVGMGRPWAERFAVSRETFAEADETLGMHLSRLCWEGPAEELQLTANTQPALLATSVAMSRAVAALGLEPALVAGHSLGEYTALVVAGALAFTDALRLVRRRGQLMQEALPAGEGAMAAILGIDAATVAAAAAEAAGGEVCEVANYNAPEQTVIAGHRGAVKRAVALARARGARRAVLLPVSAPFHCRLMRPARERLAPALAETPFSDPRVPVVCNVEATPVRGAEAARAALARQVDQPVRWVESVTWMAGAGGADLFVEVGPGAVLTGLVRRIVRPAAARSLASPQSLDELRAELGGFS